MISARILCRTLLGHTEYIINISLRLSIKKKGTGWLKKGVTGDFFFFPIFPFFFLFFFFFPKMDNTFLPKKKKLEKKIAAARLASTSFFGQETDFFYGQPKHRLALSLLFSGLGEGSYSWKGGRFALSHLDTSQVSPLQKLDDDLSV